MANNNPLSRWNSQEIVEFSDESDIDFGFLYEFESSNYSFGAYTQEDDEAENSCDDVEENKAFWDTQNQLLQATLYRTCSLEMRIRQATKEAIMELDEMGVHCKCWKPVTGSCRDCRRREILVRLQSGDYNCAICKSKWKSSNDVLPGEHTYLEVTEKSSLKKREVKVVIEINFRAEFEMARASKEYEQLVSRLPEVFVGKAERLNALIKILCSAAKKCMKEKKMHLGPWRKQKYMQAKWLGKGDRSGEKDVMPLGFSNQIKVKPRASLLTYDLLETLPVLHCSTAVQVL